MSRQDFRTACISGSMRYAQQMLIVAQQLSREGWIVVMPFVTFQSGSEQESEHKKMLDEMHLTKIDMSDRVFVVSDETGYYGDSTEHEIRYADMLDIPVSFMKVTVNAVTLVRYPAGEYK